MDEYIKCGPVIVRWYPAFKRTRPITQTPAQRPGTEAHLLADSLGGTFWRDKSIGRDSKPQLPGWLCFTH